MLVCQMGALSGGPMSTARLMPAYLSYLYSPRKTEGHLALHKVHNKPEIGFLILSRTKLPMQEINCCNIWS